MFFLGFLIIETFLFMIIIIIDTFIGYTAHVSRVKNYCDTYGEGNFQTFKKNFTQYNLIQSLDFPYSWFDCRGGRSKYHMGIIQFDRKGMYMKNIYEYIQVILYMRFLNQRNKNDIKKNEVNWYE